MDSRTVSYGSYVITKTEDDRITVERFGTIYPNTIEAIREIAKKINFEIDPKWNTQTPYLCTVALNLESVSEEYHQNGIIKAA